MSGEQRALFNGQTLEMQELILDFLKKQWDHLKEMRRECDCLKEGFACGGIFERTIRAAERFGVPAHVILQWVQGTVNLLDPDAPNAPKSSIATLLGLSETTIRNLLESYGIAETVEAVKRPEPTGELLEDLYVRQRLSIPKVARTTRWSLRYLYNKLREFGIPIRSISEACTKYPKKPFSGEPHEKAYLLGLRASDIYAWKARRQIGVIVATTVPNMIKPFEKVFGKYGRIGRYIPNISRIVPNGLYIAFLMEKALAGVLKN